MKEKGLLATVAFHSVIFASTLMLIVNHGQLDWNVDLGEANLIKIWKHIYSDQLINN